MYRTTLAVLTAATVCALDLESELMVGIEAMLQAELENEEDLNPCPFPDIEQFNSEIYLG